MEISTYEKGDIFLTDSWRGIEQLNLNQIENFLLVSPSITVRIDGEVVAILAASLLNKEVGQVITLISEKISLHPKEVSRQAKEALDFFMISQHLRKVYATVSASSDRDKKWIERFGFIPEFVMTEAGPNRTDMIGYAYTNRHLEEE